MPKRLTDKQKRKIQSACSNRFNWSDFGHWQGIGKEPNCYQSERYRSTAIIVTNFPTDDSAFRWNSDIEKRIRYTGYTASAVTAPLIAARLPTLAIAAFLTTNGINVAQGELLAHVSYPKAARGSKFKITITQEYAWSPNPYRKSTIKWTVTSIMYNHKGEITHEKREVNKHHLDEFYNEIAIAIESQKAKYSEKDY